jgi:hypothetical protein
MKKITIMAMLLFGALAAHAVLLRAQSTGTSQGISQAACQARAGHLMKTIDDWTASSGRQVEYSVDGFWKALRLSNAPASQARLLQYFATEDGSTSVPELRSGNEVALYQRIKEFIAVRGPNDRLGMDRLLQMGLDASGGGGGKVNLQIVLLTVHNVERIMARPQQWSADSQEGTRPGTNQVGHPPNDPAYPVLQDLRGLGSTGGKSLAEMFNIPRRTQSPGPQLPIGEVLKPSWSMTLYDPKAGVFQPQPGAISDEWNGGCHYYFWLGALARTTLGVGAIIGGARGELVAKEASGNKAQGEVEVSHFVCGSIFGSEAFKRRNK